ncbi:MAG: hypothetical protein ACTHKJ_01840 [Candidatus Nitrosocosmicus sp.]
MYQSVISATASVDAAMPLTVKTMQLSLPYQFLLPHKALAQQSSTATNSLKDELKKQDDGHRILIEASGEFANNQIKYNLVTWIQAGTWDLKIMDSHNSYNNQGNNLSHEQNLTAVFNASFTMIKPNGSFSHSHTIDNFTSNNIFFIGNDTLVTGVANIHSDIGMEFKHVPITIHLFNKKVIGLTIDEIKSNEHFASPNAILGTVIRGIGLDNNDIIKSSTTKSVLN